uniref:transposase n=1 Tax=uncultured Thiodictyon sp. TaxID=1846217 RepID=UPI0025E01C99
GLMQARRKNMERMAEVVTDSDEQALQHFLSNSPWDERGVLDQVARDADALLGGTADTALLIDESGITKKGRHSVGVSRQWNGRLGNVDRIRFAWVGMMPSRYGCSANDCAGVAGAVGSRTRGRPAYSSLLHGYGCGLAPPLCTRV